MIKAENPVFALALAQRAIAIPPPAFPPKVLCLDYDQGPVGYYRIGVPFYTLNRLGLCKTLLRQQIYQPKTSQKELWALQNLYAEGTATIRRQMDKTMVKAMKKLAEAVVWADIVVVHRPWDLAQNRFLYAAKSQGKLVVIDTDDHLEAIACLGENDMVKWWHMPGRLDIYRQAMGMADLITVAAQGLKQHYEERWPGKVAYVPNPADVYSERWNVPHSKYPEHPITIGYIGGHTHVLDLELVSNALMEIMERFPDVRLKLIGYQPIFSYMLPQDRVDRVDYVALHELPLALADVDISLAPLVDHEFNRLGKALAVDTPIPTVDGWKSMGEISVGDRVFTDDGSLCSVTYVSPIQQGRSCYRVSFGNGASLVTDEDHEWTVQPVFGANRQQTRTLTTGELRAGGVMVRYQSNHSRWRIAGTRPLQLPEATLPIDPYVLGAWLGDGTSTSARITCVDSEILGAIGRVERVSPTTTYEGKTPSYHIGIKAQPRAKTLRSRLRQLDLLRNKHIPSLYLRASYQQRLELLRGLMDTDGYISLDGDCEIGSKFERLAHDVRELIASLGIRTTCRVCHPHVDGRQLGPYWRVRFRVPKDRLFYIQRKWARQEAVMNRESRSSYHMIKAIEPVSSAPVRCIQVDASSALYLAGDSMIPTHNTDTKLMESALAGCAVVCSPVGQYERWGKTATYASTHEEWVAQLSSLLENPDMIQSKAREAARYVLAFRSPDSVASLWYTAYRNALASKITFEPAPYGVQSLRR
jgi:glycosyltransferase involved in cell wall biosynthesis